MNGFGDDMSFWEGEMSLILDGYWYGYDGRFV